MIGAQSQQVHGGESHVLFPSHSGEDSVRGTRHIEHQTLSLQNGEQACCARPMELCEGTALS